MAVVVVVIVAVVVVVAVDVVAEELVAASPMRRSTNAPTMRAWLCLALMRSISWRDAQSRRPCADTISAMDARKSLYGSSDSSATATLSSTSGDAVDAGGRCSSSSSELEASSGWSGVPGAAAASDGGFGSVGGGCVLLLRPGEGEGDGEREAARMELDAGGGPESKKNRSVEVRPRLRMTASDHSSDAVVVDASSPTPSPSSSSSKKEAESAAAGSKYTELTVLYISPVALRGSSLPAAAAVAEERPAVVHGRSVSSTSACRCCRRKEAVCGLLAQDGHGHGGDGEPSVAAPASLGLEKMAARPFLPIDFLRSPAHRRRPAGGGALNGRRIDGWNRE
ncbi:hypothetical protein EJB05_29418, partial [Eragrostis curvula]